MAPLWQGNSKLYDRLRNYYVKDEPPAAKPLISERTAFVCGILFTLFYVAPFYLSPTLRASPLNSRDAPTVIRARVRAVGLTCITCTLVTVYVLAIHGNATPQEVLRLLGIWPVEPIDIVNVLGLVVVLFTCSLYEIIIIESDWRRWGLSAFKDSIYDDWIGYRNLVIAPLSEEIVFRALIIPLFLLAKTSPTRMVFTTPLIFGLAHVHHLIEFLSARTPDGRHSPSLAIWINGITRSLFQFTYTSLFGFFAAFVFLRTGNLWAVVVAHSFCNRMGVPRLWGKVGQFADYFPSSKTPDTTQCKRDDDSHVLGSPVKVGNCLMQDEYDESKPTEVLPAGPTNLGTGWSVVYYALIFVGAFGFYKLLWRLTESTNALATFEG